MNIRTKEALADHIEFDHERELAGPLTVKDLTAMHRRMHAQGDHWNHQSHSDKENS